MTDEDKEQSEGRIGITGRILLAVGGTAFLALPFLAASKDLVDARVLFLGGLFLWGAAAGTSTPASWLTARRGSYWAITTERVPRARPFSTMIAFALLFGVYGLVNRDSRYPVMGAAAGLFLGACAPLFAYRLLAFLLVSIASMGFLIGVGAGVAFGVPGVAFFAGCVGFVYAALFWEDERAGFFWGE